MLRLQPKCPRSVRASDFDLEKSSLLFEAVSPIFIGDSVKLHVSREKDGKLLLVNAREDDAKVVQPDGCGQARRGVEEWMLPPGRGER
jgi:hypothetical protein